MANERTLLSYLRTALGFIAVGIPAVWWFEGAIIQELGVVSLLTGVVFIGIGIRRFRTLRRRSIDNLISGQGYADRLGRLVQLNDAEAHFIRLSIGGSPLTGE